MEFLGLLGNVDHSILEVDFGRGFIVEAMNMSEFAHICEEDFGIADVWIKLDYDWGCCSQDAFKRPEHVYLIRKTLHDYPEYSGESDDAKSRVVYWDLEHAYQNKIIEYLQDKIRKLRLLKEGSIRLSIEIFFRIEDDIWEMDSSRESTLACENRLFHLTKSELREANDYLSDGLIDSKHKYLQFAVENFELSYSISQYQLEFLSLMISLEALLNDANSELRFRVSRGCAVLLGKTKSESNAVLKIVKDLYDKRSVLVHTGNQNKITKADVLQLKDIVRRALRASLALNLPKAELSTLLMEKGFGVASKIRKSYNK
ncbi:hypothetical protein GNX18_00025 [Microbulbifer sp. SH-1]|uniref:HEPN domain-containing protein n=1 Tax=Microbulbifer sp. SH-1 TaxID=2681547 RepID=UPI001408E4CC|nr:HEPN domain-containing protein [Microbulbifer sp. SH-1]QIL88336.1 hypothetical protein GNX18_00025 [Microbulbifer sp. SH-1]